MSHGTLETTLVEIDGQQVRVNACDAHLYEVEAPEPPTVEVKLSQGGKYNVLVDGEAVTEEPIAKADAEAMAETLRG